jgi:hypothetical protein
MLALLLVAAPIGSAPPAAAPTSCVDPREHGAIGDGRHDDTEAIERAINATVAATASMVDAFDALHVKRRQHLTGPELCFGPGTYYVTRAINLSPIHPGYTYGGYGPFDAPNIRGTGRPVIFSNSTTQDIFYSSNTFWWHFSGMTLIGGRIQLRVGNNNSDQGQIVIHDSSFEQSAGAAIHMLPPTEATGFPPGQPGTGTAPDWPEPMKGSFSTEFVSDTPSFVRPSRAAFANLTVRRTCRQTLRDCKFIECSQALVNWGDWSTVSDVWVFASPKMKPNTAVFENWDRLYLKRILGVPYPMPEGHDCA